MPRMEGSKDEISNLKLKVHASLVIPNSSRFDMNDYYPLEMSSMKYCRLGLFRKEYFRLITKQCK